MQGIGNLCNYNHTQIKHPQNNTDYKMFVNNTMQTDRFGSKDKKLSKTSKVLLSLAGLGAATFTIVYGVKKYNVTNIKNIQKAFNETFLRDDITPEMARAIKARYRKIEKIKDPQEYAKALFEEAKKNYGLEKSSIKLVFEPFETKPNALGFCKRDNSAISITPKGLKNRKSILNTIHHEFRHAKQHEYLGTLEDLRTFADEIIEKSNNISDHETFARKIIDDFYKSKEKQVPEEMKEWYTKCRQGASNYTLENFEKYWNNFTEQDARKAGGTIEKYVRAKAFMFKEWLNETLSKLFYPNKNKS